jgi:hypothetical protein
MTPIPVRPLFLHFDFNEGMVLSVPLDSGHRMSLLDSNYWSGQSLVRKLPLHHQANCLAREARGCMAFIS